MTQPDARPADQASAPRGIRQPFHRHENPLHRFAASPDLARDATVRRNVTRLVDCRFRFDLQVVAGQMPGAANLAAACPGTTFVLQHACMLEDASESGFVLRNDPAHIARLVTDTVAIFGAGRDLHGSNFPIEKLRIRYPALLDAFWAAARGLSDAEQRAIFAETARQVYRLAPT